MTGLVRPLFRPFCVMGLGIAMVGCSGADTDPLEQDVTQAVEVTHAASPHRDHNPPPTQTHKTRSAESHIHGGAMISIVSEDGVVVVELETPLYNLLGFEYEPQTLAEKKHVAEVEARVNQPQSLMRFNKAAKCSFEPPKSRFTLFEAHAEDHDDDDNDGHNEIILTYHLKCDALDKLKTVHLDLFERFPNFTTVELVYLGRSLQISTDLSPSRPVADLTR